MRVKKLLFPALSLLLATAMFTSCSKDETSNLLNEMKPVTFTPVEDQVLSSEATGNVVGNKKEYREIIKKQITLNPVELVDENLSEVIFPGCVLRGDAFMRGEYSPVSIKNPKTITLSANIHGRNLQESKQVFPTLSDVRQGINDLIEPNTDLIEYNNAPAYITYLNNVVTTTESFNKTFNIHTNVNVLGGIVKAHFNYEARNYSSSGKHYVLVKVRQQFFNISMDAKQPDEWGTFDNLGEYEPVYVSSVDYGRVLHLLIETKESADSISKMIKGGIKASFTKFNRSVETEYKKQWNSYFNSGKIQIMVAGGPHEYARKIRDYDSFMDFIDVPNSKSLIHASVPIGYRVRSVRNNREVEVRSFYTEEVVTLKK